MRTAFPDDPWDDEPDDFRDLSPELSDGQFDLVCVDDVLLDYAELKIGLARTSTAPHVDVAGVKATQPTPSEYSLSPAYPNPFSDFTTIRFALRESGPARIVVYDLLGREVATLIDASLPAGNHSVTWDGAGGSDYSISGGL